MIPPEIDSIEKEKYVSVIMFFILIDLVLILLEFCMFTTFLQ